MLALLNLIMLGFFGGTMYLSYKLLARPLARLLQRQQEQRLRHAANVFATELTGTVGASVAATKKCPECAEAVQAEARICRFCRYHFEQAATSSS